MPRFPAVHLHLHEGPHRASMWLASCRGIGLPQVAPASSGAGPTEAMPRAVLAVPVTLHGAMYEEKHMYNK